METKILGFQNRKPRIKGGSAAAMRASTPLSLSAGLYGPVLAVKGSASPRFAPWTAAGRAWGLAVYEGKGGTATPGISTRTRLHKRAILQRSGAQRVFKGSGVTKRYCRRDSIGNSFVRGWPEPPGSPYGVGRISPPLFLLPNILAMPSSKRRSWLGSQPFRLFGSFALGNARFTGVSLGRIIVGVKTPTRNNEGLFRRTTATGLALLLFLSILPGCAARHMPDWSRVQAVPPETKTEVQLYQDEVPPGASRKIKGRFDSATTDFLTLRLKDGQTRTLEKSAVRKVLTRRPFAKRWPGWVALGVPFAIVGIVSNARGIAPDHTATLYLALTLPAVPFFLLSGMGGIYEVPPEHRTRPAGAKQSGAQSQAPGKPEDHSRRD